VASGEGLEEAGTSAEAGTTLVTFVEAGKASEGAGKALKGR
jgi:hypothetical protein